MCSGVVNVMVFPLTDATSFTSAIGRPARLNHDSESGKGSSVFDWDGLWRWKTVRSLAQMVAFVGTPLRFGSGVHIDVLYSSESRSTNCPAANPAPLPTVTDIEPLTPLAIRDTTDALFSFGYRSGPITMSGSFSGRLLSCPRTAPFVFCRVVCLAPAPRRVMLLLIRRWSLTVKTPGDSITTCPDGQLLMADWMPPAAF
jgi:hypothetical protein